MTTLDCRHVRRTLEDYHDGELSVEEQIAVRAHVDSCAACAAELEGLQSVRNALRVTLNQRQAVSQDEHAAFQRDVESRFRAELSVSLNERAHEWFSDMRLVYAGLAASVAALFCAVGMMNMLRLATVANAGPHSFAAIVSELAPPHTSALPSDVVDAQMLMPEELNASVAVETEPGVQDAAYAVVYVVTREGHVASVELLDARSGLPVNSEIRATFNKLTRALSRQSYAPARVGGLPVAVNIVRLVANTTVRAPKVLISEGAAALLTPLRKRTLTVAPLTGQPTA
jgi:predicted anti-sigma-YlaC factor YlaD